MGLTANDLIEVAYGEFIGGVLFRLSAAFYPDRLLSIGPDEDSWDRVSKFQIHQIRQLVAKSEKNSGGAKCPSFFLEYESKLLELKNSILDGGIVILLGCKNSGKSLLLKRALRELERNSAPRNHLRSSSPPSHSDSVDPCPDTRNDRQTGINFWVVEIHSLVVQESIDVIKQLICVLPTPNDLISKFSCSNIRNYSNFLHDVDELCEDSGVDGSRKWKDTMKDYESALNYVSLLLGLIRRLYHVLMVLKDFELLTGCDRQTLLYSLIDFVGGETEISTDRECRRSGGDDGECGDDLSPSEVVEGQNFASCTTDFCRTHCAISIVLTSSNPDCYSFLEKKVASRFAQRQIIFSPPITLEEHLYGLLEHLIAIPLPNGHEYEGVDFDKIHELTVDYLRYFMSYHWNLQLIELFSNWSDETLKKFQMMIDHQKGIFFFLQLFQVSTSGLSPSNWTLNEEIILEAHEALYQDPKFNLLAQCTILEMILLIEMSRLEKKILLKIFKYSMANFFDVRVTGPRPASVRDTMSTNDYFRFQYYHFEQVYCEYKKFVSNPLLSQFNCSKILCNQAFKSLISRGFVLMQSNRHSFYVDSTARTSSERLNSTFFEENLFKPLKLTVTNVQLDNVLKKNPHIFPSSLLDRLNE